jgi:ATP-dependent helicase/DNAse subunit B
MSFRPITFALFKNKKIDYYYDQNKETITFACPSCGLNADMNLANTKWSCNNGHIGTLTNLLYKQPNADIKRTIYNPKREKWEINSAFRSSISICDCEKLKAKLEQLQKKIIKLLYHLEGKI